MRSVGTSLGTFLGTHTACPPIRHLITVTPKTGSVVRWTDHEQDIFLSPNTFLHGGEGTTNPLPEVGGLEYGHGPDRIDKLTLLLLCADQALFNGVRLPLFASQKGFDGAVVKIERLYIPESGGLTSLGSMWWWEGPVGQVKPTSVQVELDVESGIASLNVVLPRITFQPGCPHILFDAECTLVKATFTQSACPVAASPAPTTSVFASSGPGGTWAVASQATDYFRLGVLTFTTGALSGVSRGIRLDSYAAGVHTFTADRPFAVAPAANDQFSVYPGCDKQQATCTNKFSNLVHFRGEPYVPRPETAV